LKVTANEVPGLDEECVVIESPDGLTGTFTKFGDEVFAWCAESGIDADLITKWYDDDDSAYSAWRIQDKKQRMIFSLRWT